MAGGYISRHSERRALARPDLREIMTCGEMNVDLTHAEELAHFFLVDLSDEASLAEVTLLLLCLLRQDMTVEGVLTLDLTGSGERKALLCTRISLYFRHFFVSYE